jgi:hypothetical protein
MNKRLYISMVLLSIACIACNDKECNTSSSLSFANDIQPIFNDNCATSGCHDVSTQKGGLNLSAGSSYAELSQVGSGYINTSNPKSSVLYSSMRSNMPPSGVLDKCTLEKIEKWMEQGAKNN